VLAIVVKFSVESGRAQRQWAPMYASTAHTAKRISAPPGPMRHGSRMKRLTLISVGIWLDRATLARLNQWRSPGDGYSDAIVALAEATAGR
jgi:hypothetical protein